MHTDISPCLTYASGLSQSAAWVQANRALSNVMVLPSAASTRLAGLMSLWWRKIKCKGHPHHHLLPFAPVHELVLVQGNAHIEQVAQKAWVRLSRVPTPDKRWYSCV